jgi:hypothetical protein
MRTPIESARWRRSRIAETFASVRVSASSYRLSKDVFVLAVVKAERELIQIEGQVFAADVVVSAHDTALKQRPKALHAVRMDQATHVLASTMPHKLMGVQLAKFAIGRMFVGRQQCDVRRYRLMNEAVQGLSRCVQDHLADHVTLAADSTDDRRLTGSLAASLLGLLVPMAIAVAAPDVSLIDFHDAHKLLELRFGHPGPQPMAHIPRRLVSARPDLPLNLESANAFLAVKDLPENLEPDSEGIFRVLEDGSDGDREAIGGIAAQFADPIEGLPVELTDFGVAAPGALHDAVRPATIHQELLARRFIGKGFHQLSERHHV